MKFLNFKHISIKWIFNIFIISTFTVSAAQINSVSENTDPVKLYEKFELTINLTANYTNPFDPDDIDLWASFTSPTAIQWTRVNGFWDGNEWKIRFAADEIGIWSYTVYLDDGSGQVSSNSMNFEIIKSEHHGWLRVSDDNPHYLEYSDGTSFYGTGQCRAWDLPSVPDIFTDMKSHKMNILHYWMPSWDNILVTDATGYNQYDMAHASNLDGIIENSEQNGIALMLTIWNHDELRGAGHPWPRHYFDEYNPFRNLTTANGFFTDNTSWVYQEKLYRYIIARWGYSHAIGLWQTVCEIDGTSNSENNDAVTDPWHQSINNYFKQNDPFLHPTSASKSNNPWIWLNGFSIMDVPQIHTYRNAPYKMLTDIVTEITTRTQTIWNSYDKPVFVGEFADNGNNNNQQPQHLHNGIWAGFASGGAIIPLDWNDGDMWADFTEEMYDQVLFLSQFVEPLQIDKRTFSQASLSISSEFDAYGLMGGIGIVWIQDNTPGDVNSGESLTINSVTDGKYAIDWYNTWTGEFYTEKTIETTSGGVINTTIPDFENDIICRITRVGELTEWIAYLEEINGAGSSPMATFRWKDIEDNIYDINYQNTFLYSQPRVIISFNPTDTRFSGKIFGYGLKPNFAYQMKLVGKPENDWGTNGDDLSNELIGFEGRWWRKQPNPGNTDDADYLAHKNDPDYIFEGYLVFDYLVTNEYGYVVKEFEADNSFHVLWNTVINSRTPGPNDSPISYHSVRASIQNDIYSTALSPDEVGLYGEWEPGRDIPGEVELPDEEYYVRFVLTEESFHQSGLGGNWALVMSNDTINFNNAVVPIELNSFTAVVVNETDISLNWETKTEVDNYGFDIERSVVDERWKKIGFVEGHGNSNSPKQYSFIDRNPVGGSKFKYRLKQIDTDGQFEYSDVVEVELLPIQYELYQNFPNPFNPTTTIRYEIPERSFVTIKVYDVLGNAVGTLVDEEKPGGEYEIEFDGSRLTSGIYFYQLKAGSFIETKKKVLIK